MASQLTKRGYKYRVLPTNDADTFNDFLNDDSEFNIKKLDADLEKLDDKVLLEGARQQKFDFIENKVVQGGLIENGSISSNSNVSIFVRIENYRLQQTLVYLSSQSNASSDGWSLESSSGGDIRVRIGTSLYYFPKHKFKVGENVCFYLNKTNNLFTLVMRGITSSVEATSQEEFISKIIGQSNVIVQSVYNRELEPNEIQRNLQALNNSPAIKELHTTDSTGKTSILKWATDSHHTAMACGRTLEEEYTSLLGKFGKEIDSPDGSAIQVNDGISGKVLKMSIKGQTVKNVLPTEDIITITGTGTNYTIRTIPITRVQLKTSTTYTIYTFVYENSLNDAYHNVHIHTAQPFVTGQQIPAKQTGIFRVVTTTKAEFSQVSIAIRNTTSTTTETGTIKYRQMIIEGDVNNITSYIPFGLSSTQAIISNNGQQYPIYEPTIQGKTRILDADTGLVPTDPTLPALKDGDVLDLATRTITFANKATRVLTDEEVKAYSAFKKVILCSGVDGVSDTLALKENGSVIYTKLFNTGSNIEVQGMRSDSVQWVNIWKKSDALSKSNSVSEKILFEKYSGEVNTTDNHNLYGLKFPLNTFATLEDAQNYFNGSKFIYQLKTPTVTVIDKSIIPTILTH